MRKSTSASVRIWLMLRAARCVAPQGCRRRCAPDPPIGSPVGHGSPAHDAAGVDAHKVRPGLEVPQGVPRPTAPLEEHDGVASPMQRDAPVGRDGIWAAAIDDPLVISHP